MKRSILIVCSLGFAILVGTLVSRGDSPDKSAGNKQAQAVRRPPTTRETPVYGTGEAAIEAALAQRVPFEFLETPLKDVIDYLRDALKIEIWLDENGLKDAGVDPEVPVTCNLRGCRVANVLDVILDKLQLTWTIHADVLWITSPVKAESDKFLEIRVYDVGDLVVYQDEKGAKFDDYSPLMEIVMGSIGGSSWVDGGGNGTIQGASLGSAKVLLISQSYRVHKEAAALLAKIRALSAAKGGSDEPPRREWPNKPLMQTAKVAPASLAGQRGKLAPKSATPPATK
jgi:hypothetical protein